MSSGVCFLKTVVRGSFVTQIMLQYDCMALMRYLYVFWLKDPASFNDEFWFRFAWAWIKIFCILFNGSVYFLAGTGSIKYLV